MASSFLVVWCIGALCEMSVFIADSSNSYRVVSLFPFQFVALKIHVSPQTKALLDSFGTFRLELRGDVEMKVGIYRYKPILK